MDSEATTSKPVHPLLAVVLAASSLCLGAALVLVWLLSSGQGGLAAGAFLGLCFIVFPVGAILLIVYAVWDMPWKRPFWSAWFFWLQVLVLAIVGRSVAIWLS
ncbi:hypothetical protein [Dyella silvatica]|uniref:hypothetical protein n=1 Tax=Dyella silvatica TaxID=2992128 RepID=UPI00225C3288|nr:hypothetical protein [Dyella silvatica]